MLAIIIEIFSVLIATNIAHISHIRRAHSYLDIRVKFSPGDDAIICENDLHCSIPYALAVLNSPNHFDLLSIMMQDGGLLKYNHNRYSDSTVLRVTKAMKSHSGKIHLGLRLFDLPNSMQDYIIIDATTVIENDIKKKFEIITENYRLHLYVTKEMEKIHGLLSDELANDSMNATTCQCVVKNCACCMWLDIGKIDLNNYGRNETYSCYNDYGIYSRIVEELMITSTYSNTSTN